MRTLMTILCACFFITAFAQDQAVKGLQDESQKTITKDPNDTIPKTWKIGGIVSLNVAQGSQSNWAAGGDDFSLTLATYLNGHAYYKKGKHSWDNNVDINLAYINTTTGGARKNDDRFDLTSKYGYALNSKLNLSLLGDFRSQFFKGYQYPDVNTKVYTSNFMAPAYLLLSPGLDYSPVKNLSIFVSPATARWLFVKDDSLSAQGAYGVDTGKTVKFEFGAFVTVRYTTLITKTLAYKGRLDLFSNYLHNPQDIDLYMTNLFALKISKILSATWSFDMIYDDDAKQFGPNHDAPRMQLRSLIGVGLLVKL
jgi:hypothetical protein